MLQLNYRRSGNNGKICIDIKNQIEKMNAIYEWYKLYYMNKMEM